MAAMRVTTSVSSEDFLVSKAKEALQIGDPYAAKSWMITAKTLYPNNFGVQFEAYLIEKSDKNFIAAAKCFSAVFQKFQDASELWKEVLALTTALRSDSGEPDAEFLREMFSHIPSNIQRDLLLMTAERSEDTMEHCRLLLLLLHRFPEAVSQHGPHLVDTLLTAEKHCHYQNAVNCYRKLLVCDLLPLLGSNQVDMQPKQLLRLLHKSIEFFLCYLLAPNQLIENLPELESRIDDPWKSLFKILELTGKKLRWELNSSVFGLTCNKDVWWQTLNEFAPSLPEEQLLYCTVTCFLHSLHEYKTLLGGDVPLVLVELFGERDSSEPKAKRAKLDEAISPELTVSKEGGAAAMSVVHCFIMAVRCWSLLHRTETLEKEFAKLVKQLKLDTWFGGFLIDATLYNGFYEDAFRLETRTHDATTNGILRRNLRHASINFSQGKYSLVAENVFQIVTALINVTPGGTGSLPASSRSNRHLHFLPLGRASVLQYCVSLLIATLKKNHNSDLSTGHILTLLQLDWPMEEELACQLLEAIRIRGSFSYSLFQHYIVNIDLLEEFMYLSTEQGGSIPLDIMPAAQLASQRRISTRGADKGVKEDFKLAMRRQAARSDEPVDVLMIKFLTYEREAILRAIQI